MRYEDCAEFLREEAVGESPDETGHSSCHDEHEIELRQMYQTVNES